MWHNPNGVVYGIKFTGNSNEVLRGDGSFSAFNVNGSIGWLLNGNAGTNPATNFLGTTDDASLVFKIRNLHSGLLDSTKANASFGYRAFSQNTTGSGNSAIGYKALFSNTTGGFNSAIGITSLYKNISGSANAAIGWEALFNNTEGSYNTAMGTRTLFMNQTGHDNVAVGEAALFYNATKSGLVAVGTRALHVNTGGTQNTAVGHFALAGNTFGSENTAQGYTALFANTSGNSNVYKVVDLYHDGDLLVEVGSWTRMSPSGAQVDNGHYMSVFQKKDGKYVCVRDMSVSSTPAKPSM